MADEPTTGAAGSTETVTAEKPPEAQPGLPLFYREPRPLESTRHAGKSLKTTRDLRYAAPSNSVPLTADEFVMAARNYSVVFTPEAPSVPIAVLGLRRAENLFVNEQGVWADDAYVPGYIRRYPFIFIERPETNQYALCIDEGSDLIEDGDARPLFVDNEPSDLTKRALEFCSAYHRQYGATRQFVDGLEEHELLSVRTANVNVGEGRQLTLQGIRMIDEEKFRNLDDAVFLDWRRRGWLYPIYFHFLSLTNWTALARRMGRRLRETGQEA